MRTQKNMIAIHKFKLARGLRGLGAYLCIRVHLRDLGTLLGGQCLYQLHQLLLPLHGHLLGSCGLQRSLSTQVPALSAIKYKCLYDLDILTNTLSSEVSAQQSQL